MIIIILSGGEVRRTCGLRAVTYEQGQAIVGALRSGCVAVGVGYSVGPA